MTPSEGCVSVTLPQLGWSASLFLLNFNASSSFCQQGLLQPPSAQSPHPI